jgi:pimeloyl-ACP methyl ester carboxylesterase
MNEKREKLIVDFAGRKGEVSVRAWPVERPRGRVICFHGIGSSGAEFALLATRLNELGYAVVCPDWLGHGDSDFLREPAAYRWEVYVRTIVVMMLRYKAKRVHFLGVSWGGMMLLLYLVGSRFQSTSATFVDVPLTAHPGLIQSTRNMRTLSDAKFDTMEEMEAFLFKRRPDLGMVPEGLQDYLRDARFAQRDGKYAMKYDPAVIGMMEQYGSTQFDNFRALDRFAFECYFLYGRLSPFRDPARFKPYLTRYPNLHYSDMMDAAHPPSLLTPDQIEPITAFIEKVTAGLER